PFGVLRIERIASIPAREVAGTFCELLRLVAVLEVETADARKKRRRCQQHDVEAPCSGVLRPSGGVLRPPVYFCRPVAIAPGWSVLERMPSSAQRWVMPTAKRASAVLDWP